MFKKLLALSIFLFQSYTIFGTLRPFSDEDFPTVDYVFENKNSESQNQTEFCITPIQKQRLNVPSQKICWDSSEAELWKTHGSFKIKDKKLIRKRRKYTAQKFESKLEQILQLSKDDANFHEYACYQYNLYRFRGFLELIRTFPEYEYWMIRLYKSITDPETGKKLVKNLASLNFPIDYAKEEGLRITEKWKQEEQDRQKQLLLIKEQKEKAAHQSTPAPPPQTANHQLAPKDTTATNSDHTKAPTTQQDTTKKENTSESSVSAQKSPSNSQIPPEKQTSASKPITTPQNSGITAPIRQTIPDTTQQPTASKLLVKLKKSEAQKQPEKPSQPTFTTNVKTVLKDAAIEGAGAFVGTLVGSILFPPKPPYIAPTRSPFDVDPVVQKCFSGEFSCHQQAPKSLAQLFGVPAPHAETAFDALLPGGIFSSDFRGVQQSPFCTAPAPLLRQGFGGQATPTPLTLSSPVNAAGQGGIIHDQQPSSISSSSVSSSCNNTAPLHTMDTTTTAQSCDRVAFFKTRAQCFQTLDKALELAESSPYQSFVKDTDLTVRTLDKIADNFAVSNDLATAQACACIADAFATHAVAEQITHGVQAGLQHKIEHPLESVVGTIKLPLTLAKTLFTLAAVYTPPSDPALAAQYLQATQHLNHALCAKVAQKLDAIRAMTWKDYTQCGAQLLTETFVDIITLRLPGLAVDKIAKVEKYLARFTQLIKAERSIALETGTQPQLTTLLNDAAPFFKQALEEKAVSEAAASTAQQLEKKVASEIAHAAERGVVESEAKVAESIKNIRFNEKSIDHIFRDAEGHFKIATHENKKLLIETSMDSNNLLGTDQYGTEWYAKMTPDGKQIWTQVRNGEIRNAGINEVPRTFNPKTGLSSLTKP